jgi:hypothetical protein
MADKEHITTGQVTNGQFSNPIERKSLLRCDADEIPHCKSHQTDTIKFVAGSKEEMYFLQRFELRPNLIDINDVPRFFMMRDESM